MILASHCIIIFPPLIVLLIHIARKVFKMLSNILADSFTQLLQRVVLCSISNNLSVRNVRGFINLGSCAQPEDSLIRQLPAIYYTNILYWVNVRKRVKIRNQCNQAPHLTQDTKNNNKLIWNIASTSCPIMGKWQPCVIISQIFLSFLPCCRKVNNHHCNSQLTHGVCNEIWKNTLRS